MKFKTIFSVALLCFSMAAAAQERDLPNAYEVALSDLSGPTTANGGVNFKPCSTCQWVRARVTPQTRYKVNGELVRFEDFLKTIAVAENRELVAVTVMHHPTSNQIQWLDVWL